MVYPGDEYLARAVIASTLRALKIEGYQIITKEGHELERVQEQDNFVTKVLVDYLPKDLGFKLT